MKSKLSLFKGIVFTIGLGTRLHPISEDVLRGLQFQQDSDHANLVCSI